MAIRQITTAAATAALMMLAGAGLAAPDLTEVTIGGAKALADARGMTLYTFDRDTAGSGKSVCNGPCATNWPPLMGATAPAGAGYSVIQRDDGSSQIAYKGKPLYYWAKDMKPGDKTGDGVNQVWQTAKP